MEERIAQGMGYPPGTARTERECEMHALSTLRDKLIAHIYTQAQIYPRTIQGAEVKRGDKRVYAIMQFDHASTANRRGYTN